jgi:hypothetical protein
MFARSPAIGLLINSEGYVEMTGYNQPLSALPQALQL